MRDADEEIGWLVKLVSEVRSVRTEMNVPAGAKIPLVLVGAGKATRARAEQHEDTIKRLARLDAISFAKAPPKGSAQIVLGETTAALPLAGVIDMGAERARLEREIEQGAGRDQPRSTPSSATQSFVAKAPPEVVEENRERTAEFEATVTQAAGRAQARRGGPLGSPPPHATRGQRGRGTPMPASAVALISSPSQRWRATEETMRLAGKTAIVVGAGQSPGEGMGNGRATVLLFAREGAKVLAVDHRSRARRRRRRRWSPRTAATCVAFEADVTKEATLKAAVDEAHEAAGAASTSCTTTSASASPAATPRPLEITEEAFDRVNAINLRGTIMACKHVLPVMRTAAARAPSSTSPRWRR